MRGVAPHDKGKFSADIGQDVIKEALKSVSAAASPEGPGEQPALDVSEAAPAPSGAAPPPSAAEVEELRGQLELSLAKGRELMEQLKDTHEKMLRAMADLENFKKRAQKEREEVQRFGVERLLKDFLPVVDNLDRAIDHAQASVDLESFRQGVQMTRKLFEDALAKHGIKSFSARGKPFDPHFHEAMQQLESSDVPPNHVVAEVLKGYLLNERLVRPALVVVAKAPPPPPAAAEPSPAEGAPVDRSGSGEQET